MRNIATFLTLVFLLSGISAEHSSAQEWTGYTPADGLVGSSVLSILEDTKGYLWFVTEFSGATRYDGARLQNLRAVEGLASTNINFALADKKGNVWFATTRGVSKYDGYDFENFDPTQGLASEYVTHILEDRKGNLWFGTDRGVSKYDGNDFQTLGDASELANISVTFLLQDREDNLWIGTTEGVVVFDGEKLESVSTTNLTHPIDVIFEDSNGNLWFGTEQGVFKKSIRSLRIEGPLVDAAVSCIVEARSGDLWLGTYNKGAIKFDTHTGNLTSQSGLTSSSILSVLEDSHGTLWVGTDRGFTEIEGTRIEHHTELEGTTWDFAQDILEDSDGNIWFATQNGVLKYSRESLIHFTSADGLGSNSIESVVEDREGSLWFATDNGVTKYDGYAFKTFTKRDGLPDNRVLSLLEDREGSLWFGTVSGISKDFGSVKEPACELNTAVIDIVQDRKENLWIATAEGICKHAEAASQFFTLDGITCMTKDSGDNLWIGTLSTGVYKYEGGKELIGYSMEDGLGCNHITWILEAHGGNLWFGLKGGISYTEGERASLGGVCRYDHVSFISFSTENGLPSDLITVGIEDRQGNLWFGTTDKGVIKYDGGTNDSSFHFQSLSKADGLISNYITCIQSDRNGNLWFGTDKGVSKYDGENFQSIFLDKYLTFGPVKVIFEDRKGDMWFITTNNGVMRYTPPAKEIHPRVHLTEIEADKIYRNVDEIRVPTTAKRLTFGYKGISFKTQPERIRYSHQMEGYDADWSPSTNEQRADYRGLPPQTYTFKVKAIDKDLSQSDPPASVTVHVFRPFYRTAQFLLVIVFCGVCLLGGAGYLVAQANRQRRIASEFKAKLAKQEEAERIQGAKMESLRRLVAGVAHEMNNPLGVISSSNDVSRRTIGKIKEILTERFPKEAKEDERLENTLDLLKSTNIASKAASDRVAKIVANLKRFVRLDEGEWQVADIHEGMDSVIAILEPDLEGRITVKKEYGSIPHVFCSPSSLNQVFMTILRNAIEAIEGEGVITVRTYAENEKVKVEVTDSGIGIPPGNISKIFDPGFTTKGVSVGVGLGLSICHKVIVDQHKGRIDVSSEVGKGSTFTITLPKERKTERVDTPHE